MYRCSNLFSLFFIIKVKLEKIIWNHGIGPAVRLLDADHPSLSHPTSGCGTHVRLTHVIILAKNALVG